MPFLGCCCCKDISVLVLASSSDCFSSLSGLLQLNNLEQSVLDRRSQNLAETPPNPQHGRRRIEGGRVGKSIVVVKDSDNPDLREGVHDKVMVVWRVERQKPWSWVHPSV